MRINFALINPPSKLPSFKISMIFGSQMLEIDDDKKIVKDCNVNLLDLRHQRARSG